MCASREWRAIEERPSPPRRVRQIRLLFETPHCALSRIFCGRTTIVERWVDPMCGEEGRVPLADHIGKEGPSPPPMQMFHGKTHTSSRMAMAPTADVWRQWLRLLTFGELSQVGAIAKTSFLGKQQTSRG